MRRRKPNGLSYLVLRACFRLHGVRERFQETNEEFENARKRTRRAKQIFEKIRKERFDRFMQCFEHVSNKIDDIYKVSELVAASMTGASGTFKYENRRCMCE